MGWLDNIIGWISPEWGARREVWRQYMNEVRHYDAGDYSRLNSGWYASNQSAEVTDRYSRDTVRARARDLERNSDMMNSVVGPFVRNTVGSGYVLQSYMDDQDTAREIERLWKLWCKKQNCDVTGTQSFNQMLRMAVRRKKVDGGILFVKRYTDAGMVPFQLQIFEVDELDCNQLNTKEKGNRIVGGIEYNQYNRPVGYWFRQYALDGITMMEPIYVPAKDVIFYFSKRRPSQLREISDMSQTITRIRDANEFMTAVSVKQRIEALPFGVHQKVAADRWPWPQPECSDRASYQLRRQDPDPRHDPGTERWRRCVRRQPAGSGDRCIQLHQTFSAALWSGSGSEL